MANGVTRLALAELQRKGERGGEEEHGEMKIIQEKGKMKIPLKNPSEHNHSK